MKFLYFFSVPYIGKFYSNYDFDFDSNYDHDWWSWFCKGRQGVKIFNIMLKLWFHFVLQNFQNDFIQDCIILYFCCLVFSIIGNWNKTSNLGIIKWINQFIHTVIIANYTKITNVSFLTFLNCSNLTVAINYKSICFSFMLCLLVS